MNPRRLHALFDAYFFPRGRQGAEDKTLSYCDGKPVRYVDFEKPHEKKSLSAYFNGG